MAYRFFYSKKTRKSNCLQMTQAAFLVSYLKILINNSSGCGLKPQLLLSTLVFIHLELTGQRFNSAVLHYQVNLHLSRQK